MSKLKKLFVLIVFAFIAMAVIGCQPKTVAPKTITISCDTFAGDQDEPVVVINGENMILLAELEGEEGTEMDTSTTWEITKGADKVEIVEATNNSLELAAKVAGSFTVKCASKKDNTVFAEFESAAVTTDNYNDNLNLAKNEIISKIPNYVTESFTLPKLDNERIKVTYTGYESGIFTCPEYKGDTTVTVKVSLKYHTSTVHFDLGIRVVQNVEMNDFEVIKAAKAKILNKMATLVTPTDLAEKFFIAEDNANLVDEGTKKKLVVDSALPAAEVGKDVTLIWEDVQSNTSVQAKKAADGSYYLLFIGSSSLTSNYINCRILCGNNSDIIRFNFATEGANADTVYQYMLTNGLPKNNSETKNTYLQVPIKDTKNKYPKLTIEWTCDSEGLTYNEKNHMFNVVTKGTYVLNAVMYYNKKVSVTEIFIYDENGNKAVDANGKFIMEQVETISYDWKKEISITYTFK